MASTRQLGRAVLQSMTAACGRGLLDGFYLRGWCCSGGRLDYGNLGYVKQMRWQSAVPVLSSARSVFLAVTVLL